MIPDILQEIGSRGTASLIQILDRLSKTDATLLTIKPYILKVMDHEAKRIEQVQILSLYSLSHLSIRTPQK